MAINFDSLPTGNPNGVPPKGAYYAKIEKAEMKQPQDPAKRPYLSMTLVLKNSDGKSAGKVFDNIFDSDHETVRYKLFRFIKALEIPLTGSFELKDLAKIVQGKELIVDITKEEKDGKPPKAVVDVFSNEVYYSMAEASNIFGGNIPEADDDLPFDAEDAEDAVGQPPSQENTEY